MSVFFAMYIEVFVIWNEGKFSILNTAFPRRDASATIRFVTGIVTAFNRGKLLFEGGVYFSHVMLAWPLPRLNTALMVVVYLRIGTRQHSIYAHVWLHLECRVSTIHELDSFWV